MERTADKYFSQVRFGEDPIPWLSTLNEKWHFVQSETHLLQEYSRSGRTFNNAVPQSCIKQITFASLKDKL